MKAICCVKDVSSLTKGKEYEVIDAGDGTYWLINDNGNLWCSYAGFFRLAPVPVPEPVNEWMQVSHVVSDVIGLEFDQSTFINVATGRIISFDNVTKTATIDGIVIGEQYAEAFAQTVWYKWEE